MDKINGAGPVPYVAARSAVFSLIFRPGRRPSTDDILCLVQSAAGEPPNWAVSHQPPALAGWLEIMAAGLTFDLAGLSPAAPAPLPAVAHSYGFADPAVPGGGEAITLIPGERLRSSQHLLPVVRIMAQVAARLAQLADVSAVVWHPARTALPPVPFADAIGQWLRGGAFPALGLTALFRDDSGAVRSEGLAFFTGHELSLEPSIGISTVSDVKIAARFINQLVGSDPIHQAFETDGPSGEQLRIEPPGSEGLMRIWRKS